MELPQLRSVTSMELGCDARGYSRAGNETAIWIQEALSIVDKDQPLSLVAVVLKEKWLTFTWLSPAKNSYETCRPRRDITDVLFTQNNITDVPQLIIVRYKMNATEDSIQIEEKKPKNMLEAFLNDDVDLASQLVAWYNGSEESSKIIKWISQIIEDGDSRELPLFLAKTPALVPEDADPICIMNGIHNRLGDPRIGPVLLLRALKSLGSIWLRRSQSTHPIQSNNQTQPSKKMMTKIDQIRDARRERCQTKIVLIPSLTQNPKMLTRCHYQILTPSNRWRSKESRFDIKQIKHMGFSK
ncbi:unnamed protein product [Camellia sinensis]